MKRMSIEAKLAENGIRLTVGPAPVGNYLPYRVSGKQIHLSGSICLENGKMKFTGAVGREQSVETAYQAARLCAINQLCILKDAIGDLERVRHLVSLTGFVWGVEGFAESPKVINGASDFFVQIFGEKGKHSRAAVSVSGLPAGSTVEVQCVFELE